MEGIDQEIWGILIAYNLVRMETSRIAKEANVYPLRISFMMALRERVMRYILLERKNGPNQGPFV
ncbi:hypothetical protein BBM40_23390 [Vibrio parahaemolyticus]|nr:hypothetical protein WR36_03540 [Vibrio parahaemolyticus]OAR29070.1 hypothetical protein EN03_013140 [Vibrio parahaemolyticus]OAR34673.1 hypothetical protein EM99_022960 [Vibrio parahaemolyticus]OAR60036.1 hypothetical protein EM49_002630 [Vibrio parahaemolyticus]OAR67423.1 hypothetical protein EM83_020175 [Vibrio parahaemolyticus]